MPLHYPQIFFQPVYYRQGNKNAIAIRKGEGLKLILVVEERLGRFYCFLDKTIIPHFFRFLQVILVLDNVHDACEGGDACVKGFDKSPSKHSSVSSNVGWRCAENCIMLFYCNFCTSGDISNLASQRFFCRVVGDFRASTTERRAFPLLCPKGLKNMLNCTDVAQTNCRGKRRITESGVWDVVHLTN